MSKEYEINMTLSWLSKSMIYDYTTVQKLIDYFHGVSNIWLNFDKESENISFIKNVAKKRLIENRKNFEKEFQYYMRKKDYQIINIFDEKYPESLRNIDNPPYVLFCQGDLGLLENRMLAIIGSRKSTSYGQYCAKYFAREMAKNNITIISGMANGIDGIAHRTCLENSGQTIGVIASGLNINYPASNKSLYEKMKEDRGLLISEFYFDTKPLKYNFPLRNRIISGLSEGVLVIEAAKSSGTLITANYAANQGKTVFAVPGNIDSIFSLGTNALLKDGAILVTEVQDILDELGGFDWVNTDKKSSKEVCNLSDKNLGYMQIDILKIVSKQSMTIDEIVAEIKCDIEDVMYNITLLELQNYIFIENNKIYFNMN